MSGNRSPCNPSSGHRETTILGFDFGTKRIGIAIGNTLTGTARPLTVLPTRDGAPDWEQIGKLVAEWQPGQLVVGLPLNMDGSESEMSTCARSFARKLAGRLVLPVAVIDERLSSFEARNALLRTEQKRGQPAVDALAAALIVEAWLAQQPHN